MKPTTTYKCTDGVVYQEGQKEMAEKHQELVNLEQKYKDARSRYFRALTENQITADGKMFDFTWGRYWHVFSRFYANPVIEEITIQPWQVQYDWKNNFVVWVTENGSETGPRKELNFRNLYAHESEARKKFKELMKEYLNGLKEKYEIEDW